MTTKIINKPIIKQIGILISVAIISFAAGHFINQKKRLKAEIQAEFYYNIAKDVCDIYGTNLIIVTDEFIVKPKK
jgi:hypothetical protein